MFSIIFAKSCHLSLSRGRSIQSTPSYPISVRFIFHLRLVLPSGIFLSGLLINPPPRMHFSPPHACHVPCQSNSSSFDHPNNIQWGLSVTKLLVMKFSHAFCCFLPLRFKYLPQSSRVVLLRTRNAGDQVKLSGRGGEKRNSLWVFWWWSPKKRIACKIQTFKGGLYKNTF